MKNGFGNRINGVIMKTNSLFSFLGLVCLLVWIFILCIPLSLLTGATDDKSGGLTLGLSTAKQAYILGEPVSMAFTIRNNSDSRVELPGLIDVYGGTLVVFVAFEDGPYRQYLGPGWAISGTRTSKPPMLDPGGSIKRSATLLHNRAPQRGDLNEQRWKLITERSIDSEIALPKPGRYRLKAILFGKIESPPLEIHITEPQRIDDIEIWKVISNQPEYALFMQSGDLLQGTLTDQRTKDMVDALETFINFHSASTYTSHFRAAIAKHRADVERHLNATKLK